MADVVERFVSSDLNRTSGHVLDVARTGIVAINRRSEEFVLMTRERLEKLLADAADPEPKSLADMLAGYDKDAAKAAMGSWQNEGPVGAELL